MARHIEGSGQKLEIADNAALTLPDSDWSVGGWIKIYSNLGSTYQPIIQHHAYGATPSLGALLFGVDSANPDKILGRVYDSAGDNVYRYTSGALTPAFGSVRTWQHLLITRESDTFIIYQHGVLTATIDMSDVDAIDASGTLVFGNGSYCDFDFAEWAKWDAALTSGEKAQLVDGECPQAIQPANLSWYLPLLDDTAEKIVGITVTDTDTTAADHPEQMYAPRRRRNYAMRNQVII